MFLLLACLGACTSGRAVSRPARISHIVFADLIDESQRGELIADSDAMLATIPGVVAYAAGVHLATGRPTVLADYSVGIYLGFDDEPAYAAYVTHPSHVAYVEKWKPRLESLRVYDIGDDTP